MELVRFDLSFRVCSVRLKKVYYSSVARCFVQLVAKSYVIEICQLIVVIIALVCVSVFHCM